MADDKEARIRERAHRIWESEGRPDDRDHVHWEIATRIIEDEDASAASQGGSLLDEAVEESFPASDPPALTNPNVGITNDPDPEDKEPLQVRSSASGGRRAGRGR